MIFQGCFPFALSNSCSVKFANFIGLCASSPGFFQHFHNKSNLPDTSKPLYFCASSFILLIKKGRGNGPVKPWQPLNKMRKVPTPIPDKNVWKEIRQIHAQNIFIIFQSSSDLTGGAFLFHCLELKVL